MITLLPIFIIVHRDSFSYLKPQRCNGKLISNKLRLGVMYYDVDTWALYISLWCGIGSSIIGFA